MRTTNLWLAVVAALLPYAPGAGSRAAVELPLPDRRYVPHPV